LNDSIASPMRVPPDQSSTDAVTRLSAASTSWLRSRRVMRVSRVAKTNASTRVLAFLSA